MRSAASDRPAWPGPSSQWPDASAIAPNETLVVQAQNLEAAVACESRTFSGRPLVALMSTRPPIP